MSLSLKSLQEELNEVNKLINDSKITLDEGRKILIKSLNSRGTKLPDSSSFDTIVSTIKDKIPIKWKEQSAPPRPTLSEVTVNSIKVTAPEGAKIRFNGVDYFSPKTFTQLKDGTEYTFYAFYPQDDERFLKESPVSYNKVSTLLDIPGSSALIKGTKEAGYYGPTNGIITAQEIFEETGITDGTSMMSGDITWLKFSHKGVDGKYRTLFVADRHIRHSISWDHIDDKGYAYGKEITINGKQYKLRLIRGGASEPIPSDYDADRKFPGSEWDDLIVDLVPEDSISNWNEKRTLVMEKSSNKLYSRVRRGHDSIAYFGTLYSFNPSSDNGWRPVLEVL